MRGVDDLLAAALRQMTVLDETGTGVSLGGFWVKRPVVLAFVRHLGCIFCRQQVARLSKRLPETERRGGTLVVVGPAKPEHIRGFRQVGRHGDVVQQGGTFVLGPGDRVRYEWRDRYAGDHADLDDVVEALP